MIGGSYGGQIQYAVASRTRGSTRSIPIITWNDLSYSLAPNNTEPRPRRHLHDARASPRSEWIDLFFGVGIAAGAQGASVDPTRRPRRPARTSPTTPAPRPSGSTPPATPTRGTLALARHASVVDVPEEGSRPRRCWCRARRTPCSTSRRPSRPTGAAGAGHARPGWSGSRGATPAAPRPRASSTSTRLAARLLPRQPVPGLDEPLRQGQPPAPRSARSSPTSATGSPTTPGPGTPAPRHPHGVRRDLDVLRGPHRHALPLRQRRAHPGRLEGRHRLRDVRRRGAVGSSYSETSGLEGSTVNNPPSDAPGTFASFTSAPLTAPADLVGSSRLRLHLTAPLAAQTQAADAGGKLVLFAKLYDVAPDGTQTLQNRLISPVRVGDVTKPVDVTLPAWCSASRRATGSGSWWRRATWPTRGNHVPQPVTIMTSAARPRLAEAAADGPAHVLAVARRRDAQAGRRSRRRRCSRDPAGDLGGRRARREDLGHAHLLERGMSSSGMIPPPKTTMSAASRSASSSMSLWNSVMCAPDSTDSPTRSASSWIAVSTICSGVWCRPV